MHREQFREYTDALLAVDRYDDHAPNGLQVEGRAEIRRIVTGVTASLALLEAAAARGADAVLVHHGWFWRGESPCVTGMKRARLALLLRHDINLFGYHLPLDAHPQLGNNAQLGRVLGLEQHGSGGDQGLLAFGIAPGAPALGDIGERIAVRLGRRPLVVGDLAMRPARIGWCTGGAQRSIEQAVALGCELYITGEVSEPTVHVARETGIAFIAAGHHATERYGVQALGAHLAQQFGLEHDFVDIDNPA
jgi:dinuclear metal center YbgI/SA1388 family protein